MTNIADRDRAQTRDGICDDFHEAVAAHVVYRPRQVVFAEGHPSTGLHFVCYGSVKLFHADPGGRQYIMGIAGPGAILGDLGAADSTQQSMSAVAVTESRLAFLPRERLEPFVRANPGPAIRLMTTLGRELAHTRRRVRDLALKGAEGRLASLLEQWVRAASDRAPDTRIQLRYRRGEIAEMIGVSTETLIRLLAKLKKKGVISVSRREINIVDPFRLSRIASHGGQ